MCPEGGIAYATSISKRGLVAKSSRNRNEWKEGVVA